MGSIRFGLAMGFLLISIPYIESRSLWKFLAIVLIGALFHASMLLVLFLYFLRGFNVNRKILIALILAAALISQFNVAILGFFLNLMPEANTLMKVMNYFNKPAALNLAILKRALFFLVFIIFYKKLKVNVPYFETLLLCYCLSLVWFLFFFNTFTTANRLSILFSVVEPVLLTGLLTLNKSTVYRFFMLAAILLYSFANIRHSVVALNDDYNLYLPYKLFFL
jgi:hypothetical protein